MTTTQLMAGLGGAMGSHFVAPTNQLYFVELDGKLSVLDLVRSLDRLVFADLATVPPDSSLKPGGRHVGPGWTGPLGS